MPSVNYQNLYRFVKKKTHMSLYLSFKVDIRNFDIDKLISTGLISNKCILSENFLKILLSYNITIVIFLIVLLYKMLYNSGICSVKNYMP